jgi:cysteine-rich repeat protein
MRRNRTLHTWLFLSTLTSLAAACGSPQDTGETGGGGATGTTAGSGGTTPGPKCGDGAVDPGEECDDNNTSPGDGCSDTCSLESMTSTGSTTTDSTSSTGSTTTTPSPCGNGQLDDGEECDDGNTDPGDECTTDCKPPSCGDGHLHVGVEECDAAGDGCTADCKRLPILEVTGYCAILHDHRVKCWGGAFWGAVGLEDKQDRGDQPGEMGANLPAIDLGLAQGEHVVTIDSGYAHNCALLSTGKMKCWGGNAHGAAAIGTGLHMGNDPGEMGTNLPYANVSSSKLIVQVSTGRGHTCVLLEGGSVKCFGYNVQGQLGTGDEEGWGDEPNELGDNLPTVPLGTGKTAVQVDAGDYHTCALLNDGTVKCWGANHRGQLGLGTEDARGNEPGEMGDNLPSINLGTGVKVKQIAAGADSNCALLEDGRVKCWGSNECGELGVPGGFGAELGDDPGEMGDDLPAIDLPPERTVVKVYNNEEAACVLFDDNTVTCWGCDAGSADPILAPDGVKLMNLGTGRTVQQLFIGYPRTCATLDDGTIKCVGINNVGGCGQGNKTPWGSTPATIGDNLPIVPVYDDRW